MILAGHPHYDSARKLVVSHTSIGGYTLGRGFGNLNRKFGLAIDNLIPARLVTADGRTRTVCAEQVPDLFWAIRGGDGNFGIVTKFEYRLHPFDRNLLSGEVFTKSSAMRISLYVRAILRQTCAPLTTRKVLIMKTGMVSALLPAALLAISTAQGCGEKDSAAPTEAAAPPEAAAPAPAAPAAQAPETPAGTTAGTDTAAGAKVFKTYCESCHGPEGKGDGPAAAALNPKPANFAVGAFKYDANGNGTKGDVDDIRAIVRDGAAKHGGSPLMAAWPMLSPSDLDAVAAYVKSLHTS